MEKIEIRGIRVWGFHGVMPQERRVGNMFTVDVMLSCDLEKAMESDDLGYTVNYAEVVSIVREEMGRPSRLLENVAWRIREHLRRVYPIIEGGSITVSKPAPPIPAPIECVSVTTTW